MAMIKMCAGATTVQGADKVNFGFIQQTNDVATYNEWLPFA